MSDKDTENYVSQLVSFKGPVEYVGLFGIHGEQERIAVSKLPSSSYHHIYISNEVNPDSLRDYLKLCDKKDTSLHIYANQDIRYLPPKLETNYPVFLNLDVFAIHTNLGGDKGLLNLLNTFKDRELLVRLILYHRSTRSVEDRVKSICDLSNMSFESCYKTETNRYGTNQGPKPYYALIHNLP